MIVVRGAMSYVRCSLCAVVRCCISCVRCYIIHDLGPRFYMGHLVFCYKSMLTTTLVTQTVSCSVRYDETACSITRRTYTRTHQHTRSHTRLSTRVNTSGNTTTHTQYPQLYTPQHTIRYPQHYESVSPQQTAIHV